jgi:peptidyl-prolyl cis-trans isomerase A (cyclophilin A)
VHPIRHALRALGAVALLALVATALPLHSVRAAEAAQPVDVALETSAGTIVVRIDVEHAPGTARNFLHYVDTHAYDGATFYRTVNKRSEPEARIEVIQAGLGPRAAGLPPIPLEPTSGSGLRNTDGALAMARTSDPNSATTEFFIDLGDDSFLDAGGPLGPGYAVFGHVVRGMDVVRKIHDAAATGESLTPPIAILHAHRLH